jgi:geranylgeranylglycerol-phosphate geranylgeranyltransferase
MVNIKAAMKLTRIEHSFMLVFAVIVSVITLNLQFPLEMYFYLFLCPFLVSAGAFALNDYFDVETDKLNNKKTPIVNGEITKNNALLISILLLGFGIIISLPLGLNALFIAVVFAVLSVLYNYKLKDVALIGNIIISMSMAIVFIFTEIAISNTITQTSIFMGLTSMFSGLGREIYKTVQDVDGDVKARKSKTLPVLIGKNNSIHLGTISIILAILGAIYMFLEIIPMKQNLFYLFAAGISIVLFFNAILIVYSKEKNFEKIRNLTLKAMTFGLISFLISGLIYFSL